MRPKIKSAVLAPWEVTVSRLGFVVVISGIVLVSVFQSAGAFDGKRQGFVLGFGAGVGVSAFDTGGSARQWGVHTNLKAGWGLNDQTMLYYSGHSFVTAEAGVGNATILLEPSAALSYYFDPDAPSFYVTGGLGISGDLNVDGFSPGPHVMAGVGYELLRHWSAELSVISIYTKSHHNNFDKGWLMNYTLTINVLGF